MSTDLEEPIVRPRFPLDRIGLVLGPLTLIAWLVFVDTSPNGDTRPWALVYLNLELSEAAHRIAGVMLLTIIWWLTEPIPIPATGLLAVGLCVLLGATPEDKRGPAFAALEPFGSPALYFLLGGMFIGRAMTRHGLDRRIALSILTTRWAGRSPHTLLFAVGLAVCLLSMWISNTAATAMVYPVTMGIVAVLGLGSEMGVERFARSPYASMLLLITAYASSVGGVATPIGTSTNVVAMGFFRQPDYFGRPVDFVRWCMVGVPIMVMVFGAMYVWLRLQTPQTGLDLGPLRQFLQDERRKLGPWNRGEVNTLIVFLTATTLWVAPAGLALFASDKTLLAYTQRFPEEIVALLIPVMLFLLPVDWKERKFSLDISDFSRVDWGTMMLFGAGLSLGSMMFKTGLAGTLGGAALAALHEPDVWTVTALAIAAGILLSELTSNSATVTTLIPVIFALCDKAKVESLPPLLGLTFGASFGSALPVSTPPNAIVYGSGLIPIRRMIRAGIGMDLFCFLAIWVALRVSFGAGWSPFRE